MRLYFIRKYLAVLFIVTTAAFHPLVAATPARCALCQMEVHDGSKTRFEVIDGKTTYPFCSFRCVRRFHAEKKFKAAPIFAYDYVSGEKISADKAFYITRSKQLENTLEFGMPPAVIAFAQKQAGEVYKKKFEDGVFVEGYDALEKLFD